MKVDNILQVIKNDERFSVLAEILANSGISDALTTHEEVFTFFAPTDDAFSQLPTAVVRLLQCGEGNDLALPIIGRHLVTGSYFYADDLRRRDNVKPLWGPEVKISVKNNALRFGRAAVKTPGIAAHNGVVFPVDRILTAKRRRRNMVAGPAGQGQ